MGWFNDVSADDGSLRRHVVVVGAGFAGLQAAKRLARLPVDVTVIDRRNHHVFQPLLYQVATAGLNAGDIAYPIRRVLRGHRNVAVVLGEVSGFDLDAREIVLGDGERFAYDWLVVAAGVGHSYFGHPEWEDAAPGLKSIEDALEIRRRVLLAFEGAERSTDPAEQAALLTFVVVGAGPTGVELAGAIIEIATKSLAGDFRRIDPRSARVVLVEGFDRVLTAYPQRLSERAKVQLEKLGVEVRLDTRVTDVHRGGVETSSGTIASHTVLWAAGVAASPLGRALGVPLDRAGRVVVAPDLSIPGHPEVLVAGDLAASTSKGRAVPGIAPAAMQHGRHAAAVVAADLGGRRRPPFRYSDKGQLATIGRSRAVGIVGPLKLSGLPAWLAWWMVHIAYLVGFRSRLLVMFSWAWSYVTFQRGARLITGRWSAQVAPAPASRQET